MGFLLKMLVKNIKISTWCILGAVILTLFTPLTSGIENATFHYAYSGLCFLLVGAGIIFLIVEWLSSKRKSLSADKEMLTEEKDELTNMLKILGSQLGNPNMFDNALNTEENNEAEKDTEESNSEETNNEEVIIADISEDEEVSSFSSKEEDTETPDNQ